MKIQQTCLHNKIEITYQIGELGTLDPRYKISKESEDYINKR